jgi:ubiquinone/menaquinone biosynthesis C-methylase UbiE
MSQQTPPGFTLAEHDWKSGEYVDKWIARDITRTERPAILNEMVLVAPFPHDAPVRVLDVGGGNGLVTDAVLKVFPNARVTVHDYSQPMLDRAAERFAPFGDQMSYLLSDLFDADWSAGANGPFDMVVSSIAIHNLDKIEAITAVYAAILDLLAPGGVFLNCDHFGNIGGTEKHAGILTSIGYAKADIVNDGRTAIIAAYK